MSGHLGPLAAALVDDQLSGSVRTRALKHVADCVGCRFEVEQQRAMKARLDGLGAPALSGSLLDRLQAMRPPDAGLPPSQPPGGPASDAGSDSAGPDDTGSVTAPSSTVLPGPGPGPFGLGSGARPWAGSGVFGGSPGRSRVRRVLVGATSVVLLGGGAAYAAYAAGGQDPAGPPVRPAVDVYMVQDGSAGGPAPFDDPAVTAVTAGSGR